MVSPVYTYIPNMIGYGRILATIFSFGVCFSHHKLAACFYLIGQGLDALDGTAARYYNQCSKFGAVLDMLTDRMSTATLFVVLSHLYPDRWAFFTAMMVLDIVSHWFQVVARAKQTTHKGSANAILNFYYTFPHALLVFCVGHEFFLVCLYLLAFWGDAPSGDYIRYVAYVTGPIFIGKSFMHVVQLLDSVHEIVKLDEEEAREARQKSK